MATNDFPDEIDLFDTGNYFRKNMFFFPRTAFIHNRGEASKQCMYFKDSDVTFFYTNRFLAQFLTDINMKNKRTQDIDEDLITPHNFSHIDELTSAGLCNQLIESFVIDFCKKYNIKVPGHMFNLSEDYNNELGQHQTSCFAPFRRSTKVFYIDEAVARTKMASLLTRYLRVHEYDEIAYDSEGQIDMGLDLPESLHPHIQLYKRLETELMFRKSNTIHKLIARYEALDHVQPAISVRPSLDSVKWSTVGQLNFFRWFIKEGGMALLLKYRVGAIEHLEDKRKKSMNSKRQRRLDGVTKRQRNVAKRQRCCSASAINLNVDQALHSTPGSDNDRPKRRKADDRNQ